MSKKEGKIELTFNNVDVGYEVGVTITEADAAMVEAGILTLVDQIPQITGQKLEEVIENVTLSMNAYLNEREPQKTPESLREAMVATVNINSTTSGGVFCKLQGSNEAIIALLVQATNVMAKQSGYSLLELQQMYDAGIRFMAVKQGSVKKTREDRARQLYISTLKDMLFEEEDGTSD